MLQVDISLFTRALKKSFDWLIYTFHKNFTRIGNT
jgi:hypothetical protein